MRILKFGGTSVGTIDCLRAVAAVVARAANSGSAVAVVSAFAGVTNQLVAAADAAAAGAPLDAEWVDALYESHLDTLRKMTGGAPEAASAVGARLGELARLLEDVRELGHCSPATRDAILAIGERLAAPVVAAVLQDHDVKSVVIDATQLIATDAHFGEASVDPAATRRRCQAVFANLADGIVPVITGFIGSDARGRVTTLGRGGSDYSAGLLAAALDAERVEIWTDVDGVLSADPRLVPTARHLSRLSYRAAAALAEAGARVLHPKTLDPLIAPAIPVEVRAITQPDAPPTLITGIGGHEAVRAVAGRVLPDGRGAVTIVSDHAPIDAGLAARVLGALERAAVDADTLRYDAHTLTTTVPAARLTQAVRLLHRVAAPQHARLALVIAGPTGRVGRELVHRLGAGRAVALVGAINRRRMLWQPQDGIGWRGLDRSLTHGEVADWPRFAEKLQSFAGKLIFVDCTTSGAIARSYAELLRAGIAVVTPNKQGGTLPWNDYQTLQSVDAAPYRYATTVGAGLPILHALRRIRHGGDSLLGVSAVLSGTIGYVFDRLNAGEAFSAAVRAAHAAGYTEPHPRDDLDGADVTRKLLIMLREIGLALDLDDIDTESLVPAALRQEAEPVTFLARLKAHDETWSWRVRAAQAEGRTLAYVARFDGVKASVGVTSLAAGHPLARLRGCQNMAVLTTRHYCDIPLIVSGPGAGVEVTAAGLLADIDEAAGALDDWPARIASPPQKPPQVVDDVRFGT
ncbi:MAG TPA: aspartate kinase [Gammaproteobacteria bacterium]|nr:aspartate kinase [Gammaproteobacteria bacterium]